MLSWNNHRLGGSFSVVLMSQHSSLPPTLSFGCLGDFFLFMLDELCELLNDQCLSVVRGRDVLGEEEVEMDEVEQE